MKNYLVFLLFGILITPACTNENQAMLDEALVLESRLAQQYTHTTCDSLIQLYLKLAKRKPEDHANNLIYLTKAADLQFTYRDDAAPACRWIDDALAHHSEGQNLTKTIGVLIRIWNAYNYKSAPAVKMGPDDIDKSRAYLQKNQVWIDSVLVGLDKKMAKDGIIVNKDATDKFIESAEAYASLTDSPDKFAELLIKAAGLAKTAGEFNKSVQLYYKISNRLPDHPKARTALFMQGFIYENDLHELDKAKKAYEFFLEKYPNDPDYADDAQMALKTLGKSPEEILKSFQ